MNELVTKFVANLIVLVLLSCFILIAGIVIGSFFDDIKPIMLFVQKVMIVGGGVMLLRFIWESCKTR
jgi:hypothetical protein